MARRIRDRDAKEAGSHPWCQQANRPGAKVAGGGAIIANSGLGTLRTGPRGQKSRFASVVAGTAEVEEGTRGEGVVFTTSLATFSGATEETSGSGWDECPCNIE